jgi:hypothetical protein
MYCPNPECPDFKETGVPGEYVEGVTVCPFCDKGLVEEMPDVNPPREQSETEQDTDDLGTLDDLGEDLVIIATYNLRHDAELVITYLMNHGIEVFESPDDCGGTDPALGFATGTRLLVPESQATEAITLLNKVEKGS